MKNLVFLLLIICSNIFAQQNKRTLFDSLKTYHYNAIFINKEGDTLSNEKLIFKPTGKVWDSDKSQDLVIYYYTPIDSVLSQFRDLSSRKNKKFQFYGPISISTGLIETDSLIWIHPFRMYQYQLTEVAPFPEVKISKLKVGNTWTGGSIILFWGKFSGRMKYKYQVLETLPCEFMNLQLSECWHLKGIGKHSKLGESTIDYYFQNQYGFLLMNYDFYNGNKIILTLERIETKTK
jgi:hypothetical protein